MTDPQADAGTAKTAKERLRWVVTLDRARTDVSRWWRTPLAWEEFKSATETAWNLPINGQKQPTNLLTTE